VAFITSIPREVFVYRPPAMQLGGAFGVFGPYVHYVDQVVLDQYWLLFSYGPDGDMEFNELHYDPTNGTVSDGDIYRNGPNK
jgi:hypothetical protein